MPVTREQLQALTPEQLQAVAKQAGVKTPTGGLGILRGALRGGLQGFTGREIQPVTQPPKITNLGMFTQKEEKPGAVLKNLRDAAELKIVQGQKDQVTDEEISALKTTTGGQKLLESAGFIEPSPTFQRGGGLMAALSPDRALINETTQTFIDSGQIRTVNDLEELLDRREEAEAEGIDVDAVLEFFGQKRQLQGR